MTDFFTRLFDSSDFAARETQPGWDAGLGWLHNGSDILIGLAFLAIPLTLAILVGRMRSSFPTPWLVWLFGAFIFVCGVSHLLEAASYSVPLYRLTGLVKLAAALTAWLTVVALIPTVPRLVAFVNNQPAGATPNGTDDDQPRLRQYIVAILAGVAAVLVQVLIQPFLGNVSPFVLAVLAVVASAWYGGLWPALLCLLVSFAGVSYLVLSPSGSFAVVGLENQFSTGLFIFVGVGCALLGEAQRKSRHAAERNYKIVVAKQVELESEIERRKNVEEDLRLQAGDLAIAQQRTSDTLALLDTFVLNTPVGLAFFDPDLRYVLANQYLADANRLSVEAQLGRPFAEASPSLPSSVEDDLQSVLTSGSAIVRDLIRAPSVESNSVFRAGFYPVRSADGGVIGVGAVIEDVTERVRAEQALKASERRFRELAESLPQLVWTCRAAGECDYLSRQWEEYTGTPAEDHIGFGWTEALHPEDLASTSALWQQAVAAGSVFETEFRIRRHDGEYRWFYTRGVPVYNVSGKVEQWFGTNTDIHDRKQAEEEVRASERRLKQLADAMPQIVWAARPDGRIDYCNERWYELTGYPCEGSSEADWEPILHPDDVVSTRAAWQSSVETGLPYQMEHRFKDHRNGEYRWFLGKALPARDENGQIVRWFGSWTDIDETKRYAEQARTSAERFRLLTESIPQMVWNADASGRVSYFNRRWREYTGLVAEGAPHEWWSQVVHPDDAVGLERSWRKALTDRSTPFANEVRVRRAIDGEYRWFQTTVSPLHRPDGSIDQLIGSLSDIHDQKTQAETLERLVEERTVELKRSNEELEKFAYVASHDLQEPLRKIQAFGDLLQAKSNEELSPESRDYLRRMVSSASRMRQLIQDLLAYSRINTKGQPFVTVNLDEIAVGVIGDLSYRIEQSGGTVDLGPLPSIEADSIQMRQLLQNLIGNALKFHRPGVPPVVTVRAAIVTENDQSLCRLTVKDNGIGFDEKYVERIFQVFQRLHGRGEYEGTGVGLALCRKIVERHGGTITAESRLGEGSTFVVTLPVRRQDS